MPKLLLFLLLLSFLLGGCSQPANYAQNLDPQKTYQGYPCFETCADFKAGYDQAKTQALTARSSCQNFGAKQRLGCEAYINDLEIDTLDNGGLKLQ